VRDSIELATRSGGRIVCRPTKAFPFGRAVREMSVERLGREQSNTSVLIGGDVILKAFRRIQPGIHPEVEIGRFLTEVAGFSNAPPLLGSVELQDAAGEPTALAVLQGFVRNQGDGWGFTLDYLDRLMNQIELAHSETEPDLADLHVMFEALSETLGRRIAELHKAFSLPVDDEAFRPEPVVPADVEAWCDGVAEQAHGAEQALRRALAAGLPEDVHHDVDALLGRWAEVEAACGRLRGQPCPTVKTRIHGDLHLGQVVVVREDFFILDFEGEPLRPMTQRRAKQSPLKDVAGMLRSFEYAASAALQRRLEVAPGVADRLRRGLASWQRAASQRFLGGYRSAVAGCASIPPDDAEFIRLLDLFLLEKVLYEIRYEAANRPDWLAIPVKGALRLLSATAAAAGGAPRP